MNELHHTDAECKVTQTFTKKILSGVRVDSLQTVHDRGQIMFHHAHVRAGVVATKSISE